MMQNVMTVAESAAFNVLTTETDVDSFFKEGTECHGFTKSPVDSA